MVNNKFIENSAGACGAIYTNNINVNIAGNEFINNNAFDNYTSRYIEHGGEGGALILD